MTRFQLALSRSWFIFLISSDGRLILNTELFRLVGIFYTLMDKAKSCRRIEHNVEGSDSALAG